MTDLLNGKTALIVGGTTGIGRAAADQLAHLGARVMINGRHEAEMDAALDTLRQAGGEARGAIGDITRLDDVRRIFSECDQWSGGVDILVNCAAVPANDIRSHSLEEMAYAVHANLVGMMACCHEAIQRMRARDGGHIINIGSMSSDVLDRGASLYVATKSAVRGFTIALRKEVAEWNIDVSLIEPGATGGGMVSENQAEQEQMQADMVMFKPEDVAAWVVNCVTQPAGVSLAHIKLKPHRQMI